MAVNSRTRKFDLSEKHTMCTAFAVLSQCGHVCATEPLQVSHSQLKELTSQGFENINAVLLLVSKPFLHTCGIAKNCMTGNDKDDKRQLQNRALRALYNLCREVANLSTVM